MNKRNTKHITLSIFTIAVISRLLPHAPNFTPVESIALFGGVFFINKFKRFLLPIFALYLTDLILNNTILRVYFANQDGFIWISDYMLWNGLSILGIAVIGYYLSKKVTITNIGISAVGASLLFFFFSNIGAWFTLPMYTKDLQGLSTCFIAALPFFRTSLISTLVFSYVLIGGYYWMSNRKLEIA